MTRQKEQDHPAVREVEQQLRRVANPVNYHAGRPGGDVLKPENILIFYRRSPKELQASFHHQHHRYVLITAVRGAGVVGIDTRTHPLCEGQSLLVLPFQTHWYENIASAGVLWAFVTFEHPRDKRLERLRDRGALNLRNNEFTELKDLLGSWRSPAEADLLGVRLAIWLHFLTQSGTKPVERPSRKKRPNIDGEWVGAINRFIFDHREKPLGVEEIARGLSVSTSLLRSKFRRLTGESVGRHVRQLKLQYACELLHDTKLRINEVAERCGYDSLFSFSRAFQNCYKISPSGYRKKFE